MSIKATGQITLVDLTDGQLVTYLSSNLPKTQIYNKKEGTFSPDWRKTPLQIVPNVNLNQQGISLDLVQVTYKKLSDGKEVNLGDQEVVSNGILTVNQNILKDNPNKIITYIAYLTYKNFKTKTDITFSLLNDGINGENGKEGVSGYTVFLSNESYLFKGNDKNGLKDSVDTNLIAIQGNEEQFVQIVSVNGKTPSISLTETGITGLQFKVSALAAVKSPTITFASSEKLLQRNGIIPITFQIKDKTFTKFFSYGIALQGDAAINYWMINNVHAIKKDEKGNLLPKEIKLEAKSSVGKEEIVNYYGRFLIEGTSDNKIWDTLYQSEQNEFEKVFPLTNKAIIAYRCSLFLADSQQTVLDKQTIPVVFDGKDGANGQPGKDGTSISILNIQYQEGTSATIAPTGTWSNDPVKVAENNYLWTKTTFSDKSIAYGVAKQGAKGKDGQNGANGKDGANGQPGKDGNGIKSVTISYAKSATIVTDPSQLSWGNSMPTVPEDQYLYTRTITDYTKSADTTVYTYAKQGKKGTDGKNGSNGVNGTNGKDGRSVASIVEMYYKSTSATQLSGGTWSTVYPGWENGKYIWTKSVINYSSGNPDETKPICVSGSKGTDGKNGTNGANGAPGKDGQNGTNGTDGISVTKVDVWYYLSTSSTSLTGGSWSTNAPAWTQGKYMWSKTVTTYSKGSPTESKPICISGSKGDTGKNGQDGTNGTSPYNVILTNESQTIAGSITNALATTVSTKVIGYHGSTQVNTQVGTIRKLPTGMTAVINNNNSQNTEIVFNISTNLTTKNGQVEIPVTLDGKTITKIFSYSLSLKGNTGENGKPGEDARLVTINSTAQIFKSADGGRNFAPDTVVLTPYLQKVEFGSWQYSTNGGQTWKTISNTSKSLNDCYYDSATKQLTVPKDFKEFTQKITSITFKCVGSISNIYDTITISKLYDVTSLEIGGRNLVLKSNAKIVDSSNYELTSFKLTQLPITGEEYTITIKGSVQEGGHLQLYFNHWSSPNMNVFESGKGEIQSITFTFPSWEPDEIQKNIIGLYNTPPSEGSAQGKRKASIEWIKFEKGNKSTDWTPAPEDFQQEIKNQNDKIGDIQTHFQATDDKINGIVEQIGDRSKKTTSITADIDGINSVVKDIEDVGVIMTGVKTITLDNCIEKSSLEIHLYGDNNLFKNNKTLFSPKQIFGSSTSIFGYNSILQLENSKGEKQNFDLHITEVLRSNGKIQDEYIFKNGKAQIIRRINSDGSIKQEPIVENLPDVQIELFDGTNSITVLNYSPKMKIVYTRKNNFTESFATNVQLSSEIKQSEREIALKLNEKVDNKDYTGAEIALRINQDKSQAIINADNININGIVSANQNFKILKDGSMEAQNGLFKGNLRLMKNNKDIANIHGLLTNLAFYSIGNVQGYNFLGFNGVYGGNGLAFHYSDVSIGVTIPKNFVIDHAILLLETLPVEWFHQDVSSGQETVTTGSPKDLKLFIGNTSYKIIAGYGSEWEADFVSSLTEVPNAFESNVFTPPATFNQKYSINIKPYLHEGYNNLIIRTAKPLPGLNDAVGASYNTGAGRAMINIVGYSNF